MSHTQYRQPGRCLSAVAIGLALGFALFAPRARANVYATNIKLNSAATNLLAAPGDSVTISYILNEPASLGVTIDFRVGGSVVRSLSIAPGDLGSLVGPNYVIWDGLDAQSNAVASGTCSVSITAASSGYAGWTQLTSDGDPQVYVWEGHGIAVDVNAGSQFYGRIFVANSKSGPNGQPGDLVGILKRNADGSEADEGVSSAGVDGYNWTDDKLSPWKLSVSADDYVYVDDLANGGEIYRWDPTISSNSLLAVLRADNRPSGANLSGPALFGQGAETQLWMADRAGGRGLLRWRLTADGTCAQGDTGLTVVGIGTNLTLNPVDVALDGDGNIYTCQAVTNAGSPAQRVFRFPAYDPSTNGNQPELTADWAVGAGDNSYAGASGLAVDPSGSYVAVAFQGLAQTNGMLKILNATNGALVTTLGGAGKHQDLDCAWDAVGNVYYLDDWFGVWRAVSPPGTNQAATVSPAVILFPPLSPPFLTGIAVSGSQVQIDFTAPANDSASAFALLSAPVAEGPYALAGGASTSQLGPGRFRATVPVSGQAQFYRIQR